MAFAAVPVAVLSVGAGAAFTFGQDVSQLNGTQEQTDYLVVASDTTSSANSWMQSAYIGGAPGLTGSVQNIPVTTKYGELPQWFQVDTGAVGVPSAVQESGDLAFINGASSTTSPDDTNNGTDNGGTNNLDVVQAIHVKGNITNVAALRQSYGTCLIPIRLWSTTDTGTTFADVTQDYLDTQNRLSDGTNGQTPSSANPNSSGTDPFYVDCTTGEIEFTVPTDVAADHKTAGTLAYELSVERGGVFATFNNNTGAQPEFVFQATPIAYDPTDQFNTPGSNGDSQYTPNVKSDKRAAPAPMTLNVHITSNPTTVAMPLWGTVTHVSINWGDGTITGPFNAEGDQSHDYTTTGDYTISISGTKLQSFGQYGTTVSGAETIKAVNTWGGLGLEYVAFTNMTELTAVPATLPATVTSLHGAFYKASSFNQDISGWNTSNVTDMGFMFAGDGAFNQSISGWNTSNVTNVAFMFQGASAFNQPIGGWDTGNVTNMNYMFEGASAFNQPLGTWDTSNVTSMKRMFYGATAFNQPLGTWDTGNVTDMGYMFYGATAFNQPVGAWDTSHVLDMSYMFRQATSFNRDLGGWNVGAVTSMRNMLDSTALSSANYGSTLVGWQGQTHRSRVTLGASGLTYPASASTARAALVTDRWSITDAGQAP